MKSQKGIIHLGLILVLLVLGIGALMYVMYKTNSLPVVTSTSSPTPEAMVEQDIVDWKTYANSEFGFRIQYLSAIGSNTTYVEENQNYATISASGDWGITIYFYKNSSLESVLEKLKKDKGNDQYTKLVDKGPSSFNGYDSRVLNYESEMGTFKIILLENSGNVIEIEALENIEKLYQILSTFKFNETLDSTEYIEEIRQAIISRYPDLESVNSNISVQKFFYDVYIASWNQIDKNGDPLAAGGNYDFVKKINGKWVIADSNLRCQWLKDADLRENDRAFYGLTECK